MRHSSNPLFHPGSQKKWFSIFTVFSLWPCALCVCSVYCFPPVCALQVLSWRCQLVSGSTCAMLTSWLKPGCSACQSLSWPSHYNLCCSFVEMCFSVFHCQHAPHILHGSHAPSETSDTDFHTSWYIWFAFNIINFSAIIPLIACAFHLFVAALEPVLTPVKNIFIVPQKSIKGCKIMLVK